MLDSSLTFLAKNRSPNTTSRVRGVVPVRVHRDALCKSVELRKLSRLAKYRCTKRGVPSLTVPRNHPMDSDSLSSFSLNLTKTLLVTYIIPHSNRSNSPLPVNIMVTCRMNIELKELQQLISLRFLQLSKTCQKSEIDVQCFQASYWMCADCRMMSVDRWPVWLGAQESMIASPRKFSITV